VGGCFLVRRRRLVTPEQGSQTGPVSAHGHVGDSAVTDERILQISTVWRCVSLISTLTACLPMDVFETDSSDNRTKVGLEQPAGSSVALLSKPVHDSAGIP
jgi:phage portal protein BeeE